MSKLSPILRARRRITDSDGNLYENAPENSTADSAEGMGTKPRPRPRRLTYGAGDVLQDRTNMAHAGNENIVKSQLSPRKLGPHSPGRPCRPEEQRPRLRGEACSDQRSRSLSVDRLRGEFEPSNGMRFSRRGSRRGLELKDENVAEGWWEGVWDKVQQRAKKATVAVTQVSGKATVAVSHASKAIGCEVSAIREDLGLLTKDLSEGLLNFNASAQCFLARAEGPGEKWNRPEAVEWVCDLDRGEGPKLARLGLEVAWDENGPLLVTKIEKGCVLDNWALSPHAVEVKLLPSNAVSVVQNLRICSGDEIIAIDGRPVKESMASADGRTALMKGLRQCQFLTFQRRMVDPRRQALCRPRSSATCTAPSENTESTRP